MVKDPVRRRTARAVNEYGYLEEVENEEKDNPQAEIPGIQARNEHCCNTV